MQRYFTLKIDKEKCSEATVLQLAHSALETNEDIELKFLYRPKPEAFKNLLLFLQKKLPKNRWFLSEADSIIAGVLFRLNFSRPRRAVIEIANGCNLKCDFCWTHSPYMDGKLPEGWLKKTLSTDVIRTYLDDLYKLKTVRLVEFCAVGDPLYHPEIWQLIEYAKQKQFRLRLSTNGTLLMPSRWDRFCENPVDELFMNISSGDRDTYADIHNVKPTVYDQLITNLKHINQERKRLDKKVEMRWINIITNKNIGNIPKIVDAGLECGADYFDFRYVWVHQDFQKKIGLTKDILKENEGKIIASQKVLEGSKVRSNLSNFYDSVYAGGVQ